MWGRQDHLIAAVNTAIRGLEITMAGISKGAVSLEHILALNRESLEKAEKVLKDPKTGSAKRQRTQKFRNALRAQNYFLQRTILSNGKTAGTA
jgi:hypothetical protein